MSELWKSLFDALDTADRRLLVATVKAANAPQRCREAREQVVLMRTQAQRAAYLTPTP